MTALVVSKRGGHQKLKKRLKNYYSNTNSDSACCFYNGQDIFSLEIDCRTIIQIQIATALVVLKGRRHLQFGNRLEDYYSNTTNDSACCFEKWRTSSVRKEIEGLLFKYE